MTPTHHDGMAAARRVLAANQDGSACDALDALTMLTYHFSLELRRIPERERITLALQLTRQIIANTRESLD